MCRQIAVTPILRVLFDTKPADAFCVIGVTMEDLYEDLEDTFVVGMAWYGPLHTRPDLDMHDIVKRRYRRGDLFLCAV
jgi:hypothetical protein